MSELSRSTDSIQADVCAACHSIIQESNGSPVRLCLLKLRSYRPNSHSVSLLHQVVYGMDHKFCTEGCRCVFFFGQCSSGGGLETQLDDDDMVFRKRYNAGACPCLHFNATCPHFASFAAGLVRNKWGFNKVSLRRWRCVVDPDL
mmetsp:Transcript_17019/g.34801  ORF Transcript_17019/g.34801 Transcript_17019/m.34801 type:complete len:145 (-) Transcript_17019:297-731(-)